MDIITDTGFKNDLFDIARLFDYEKDIEVYINSSSGALLTKIITESNVYEFSDDISGISDKMELKRLKKRHCKKHLYDILKESTGKYLAWGSLTGIRPVRLYNQLSLKLGEKKAEKYFTGYFDVSPRKTALVKEIASVQKKYYTTKGDTLDLYIGIPFCKGRCSYCSFFSADADKNKDLIDVYTETLIKDILCAKQIIQEKGFTINSVYVGGGTPSSLPLRNLKAVLNELKGIAKYEFTVEAGRPDSINNELLDMLKDCGVGRISINPQSASNETLRLIGRRHTFEDVLRAYNTAKDYGFIINMDIIAGLPGEGLNDFIKTVNAVSQLKPHNITVHTLAIKQGSVLKTDSYRHNEEFIEEMHNYAYSELHKCGYNAYYMYKQKNAAGNLENTGYSLSGNECRYNIDNMEDTISIIACGANSISKRVFNSGRIERLDSPKDIKTYCGKAELFNLKKEFFN